MKERPILFNEAMVRAIIDGSKTQTRRVIKPQPKNDWSFETPPILGEITSQHYKKGKFGVFLRRELKINFPEIDLIPSPYGRIGHRLWVRETFDPIYPQDPNYNGGLPIEYDYKATYTHGDRLGDSLGIKKKWKPSIHMPRRASRITLEITNVRVERLQDISEDDCISEGIVKVQYRPLGRGEPVETHSIGKDDGRSNLYRVAQDAYQKLWESINGAESWNANPWVWVIEFKRVGEQS